MSRYFAYIEIKPKLNYFMVAFKLDYILDENGNKKDFVPNLYINLLAIDIKKQLDSHFNEYTNQSIIITLHANEVWPEYSFEGGTPEAQKKLASIIEGLKGK